MIGLRVYELKQDKDRDVRDNTVLINVSDEVLKLSVMLNKMNALEIPNEGEMEGSGSGTAKISDDADLDSTLDKTLDTTTSDGSDTIIESLLTNTGADGDSSGGVVVVEKALEVKEGTLAAPTEEVTAEQDIVAPENYQEEW